MGGWPFRMVYAGGEKFREALALDRAPTDSFSHRPSEGCRVTARWKLILLSAGIRVRRECLYAGTELNTAKANLAGNCSGLQPTLPIGCRGRPTADVTKGNVPEDECGYVLLFIARSIVRTMSPALRLSREQIKRPRVSVFPSGTKMMVDLRCLGIDNA